MLNIGITCDCAISTVRSRNNALIGIHKIAGCNTASRRVTQLRRNIQFINAGCNSSHIDVSLAQSNIPNVDPRGIASISKGIERSAYPIKSLHVSTCQTQIVLALPRKYDFTFNGHDSKCQLINSVKNQCAVAEGR